LGRAGPSPAHRCGPCRGPTGRKLGPGPNPPSGRASPAHIISYRAVLWAPISGRARAGLKSPVHIPSTTANPAARARNSWCREDPCTSGTPQLEFFIREGPERMKSMSTSPSHHVLHGLLHQQLPCLFSPLTVPPVAGGSRHQSQEVQPFLLDAGPMVRYPMLSLAASRPHGGEPATK
jgi:hypothetical protein